ncbi:MAG: hypothetical protein JXR37_21030 [Kiritimatiellae bacterium]|nr:hypothetical protein [Kiritimatiellia bacterium]
MPSRWSDSGNYYKGSQLQAVRCGKWKLHLPRTEHPRRRRNQNRATDPKPVEDNVRKIPTQLYELEEDIGEKRNVADQHPDLVKRLTALANAFDKDLKANARPPGRSAAGGR